MKRVLGIVVLLLLGPCALLAQHHGNHGAGTANNPAAGATSDDLSDFKLAVAMQATPEQAAQFRALTSSLVAARKSVREVSDLAASGGKPDFPHLQALSDAVDDVMSSEQKFLAGFSREQKSGLKPLTKKISKTDSDILKESKTLQQLTNSPANGAVDKLDQALAELQTHHSEIAKQMGIQLDSSSLDTKN
jgi:hypothetical protein